jgi:hypothetical protein
MTYLVNSLKTSIVIRYVGHEQAEPSAEIYVLPLSNLSAERMCGSQPTNAAHDAQCFCLQDGR